LTVVHPNNALHGLRPDGKNTFNVWYVKLNNLFEQEEKNVVVEISITGRPDSNPFVPLIFQLWYDHIPLQLYQHKQPKSLFPINIVPVSAAAKVTVVAEKSSNAAVASGGGRTFALRQPASASSANTNRVVLHTLVLLQAAENLEKIRLLADSAKPAGEEYSQARDSLAKVSEVLEQALALEKEEEKKLSAPTSLEEHQHQERIKKGIRQIEACSLQAKDLISSGAIRSHLDYKRQGGSSRLNLLISELGMQRNNRVFSPQQQLLEQQQQKLLFADPEEVSDARKLLRQKLLEDQ
jgi:hypothetical protein